MIIRLPHCYPLNIKVSTSHWEPNGTQHGAKSNPRALALTYVILGFGNSDWGGRRLWLYVRGGYALYADVYVDRRAVA